jgi:hypothetical protein
MNIQYQVSKSDYQILIAIYQMLKGGKSEITRQSVIQKSGVSESSLRNRINNVYIKENILKEKNYE